MAHWQRPLDEWLRTHHGIVTVQELSRLGVSDRTISRMLADGRLVSVFPGVHRSAQWPASPETTMRAVCARNSSAVIAFTTAARLWGFRRLPGDRSIHVLVPAGSSPSMPGVVVHRCRRIDAVDVVERPDGIRLTSPPRSAFDIADVVGLSAARSITEQLLHEKMTTLGTIVDTYMRLQHPRRPGSRVMGQVLSMRPRWRAALHSNLELLVLEECERQGLPPATTQCPVVLADGRTIHLDLGWPEWKVGIEVDHPAWHGGEEERTRDADRDRKATAVGWSVVRITRLDVEVGLANAVRDIAVLIGRPLAG